MTVIPHGWYRRWSNITANYLRRYSPTALLTAMPNSGSFFITIIFTHPPHSLNTTNSNGDVFLSSQRHQQHICRVSVLDHQVYGVTDRAPFSQQTPFEKRTIHVNETVSTIVALVYLLVWLVGMIAVCAFCCRSRPRDRKLNLSLPWRRERAKGKQPEGSDMGLTVWSAFFLWILVEPTSATASVEDWPHGAI